MSITIGDVVTLQNDSVSEMVKQVLQNVEIPLDKVRVDQSHFAVSVQYVQGIWLKYVSIKSDEVLFLYIFFIPIIPLHIENFEVEIKHSTQICCATFVCQSGFNILEKRHIRLFYRELRKAISVLCLIAMYAYVAGANNLLA